MASMINLKIATDYLEKQNWSIIPVGRNKKPLIRWIEFQSQKPSVAEIEQWFKQFPQMNIAVVTGRISNLTVIDIDPRNGGSDELFKHIKTVKSKTGNNGFHYFFKYEPKLTNINEIRKGIEVKSDGHYVILPPSVNDKGGTYEWLTSLDGDIKIVNFPAKTLPKTGEISIAGNESNNKAKADFVNGVSKGSRNDTAASLIGKWIKYFPSSKWEKEVWQFALLWNQRNKPPLNENELREVFDSICKKENGKTKTPLIIPNEKLLDKEITYEEVEQKVEAFLPNSKIALKIILAVAISSCFKNPVMLWLLLVGVPSSGKTDLVRLIKKSTISYYLDSLTQNAFISGERQSNTQKVFDLLPEINNRCLVIKDWTAIFSLDEKMTRKILGDLVGIYDREFAKFSSRRGNISYKSVFSQVGCITPSTLNRHTTYMNMVGPRFINYSMPETTIDQKEESFKKIFANEDRFSLENEASIYVSSFLNQLAKTEPKIQELDGKIQEYLKIAALLMANCRGIVLLQAKKFFDDKNNEITAYEPSEVQIEEPWRAVQQLIELSRYLAFVAGKNAVGVEELAIIKDIVLSSMPADRANALQAIKLNNGEITIKGLGSKTEISYKTSSRLLNELVALKVVDKIPGEGQQARVYQIKEDFKDFVMLSPAEFLSNKNLSLETEICKTETPQGVEKEGTDGRLNRIKFLLVKLRGDYFTWQNDKSQKEQLFNNNQIIFEELEKLGVSRCFSASVFSFGPEITEEIIDKFKIENDLL